MTQDNNTLPTSEKLNLVNYETENIKDLIYTIRGKQVMKELYHVGASLKDLGKKCFAISKMEDLEYINKMEEII